jgi:hypothetical protein
MILPLSLVERVRADLEPNTPKWFPFHGFADEQLPGGIYAARVVIENAWLTLVFHGEDSSLYAAMNAISFADPGQVTLAHVRINNIDMFAAPVDAAFFHSTDDDGVMTAMKIAPLVFSGLHPMEIRFVSERPAMIDLLFVCAVLDPATQKLCMR